MQLTIDVNDSVLDKVMYLLNSLKKDVKIINKQEESSLDIEIIKENDEEYKYILEGRKERKENPQNYVALDSVDWDSWNVCNCVAQTSCKIHKR